MLSRNGYEDAEKDQEERSFIIPTTSPGRLQATLMNDIRVKIGVAVAAVMVHVSETNAAMLQQDLCSPFLFSFAPAFQDLAYRSKIAWCYAKSISTGMALWTMSKK
jgi:hypothetical protein